MGETLEFGGCRLGRGEPVFVIAEAGVNHDGRVGRALELVDAAADAGADAVKFQTFDADALATTQAPAAGYQRERAGAESQLELLRGLELSADKLARVARHARERGIEFLSTPFDEGSAAVLAELGVAAFKIGSGELTNLPLLRAVARYGRPLLVSTGMATLEEVNDAVAAIRGAGAPLALFHCVSSYPAPEEEANLRALATLRDAFSVPVGWSDHCLGTDATIAAVALGAVMIERHLTLDRSAPGPDHAMSLEPGELTELIARIRTVERALGDGVKRPMPSELDMARVVRRSIVAAHDLEAGDVVTANSLAIKRPGGGLPPADLDRVVGRRLARALKRDEPLTAEHLVTG